MRILKIAGYELLKNARDVKMFLGLVIFPIILILILGTTLHGNFSGKDTSRITVGYINGDTGSIGIGFNKFIEKKEVQKSLKTIRYGSLIKGKKAVTNGKIDLLIIVEKNISGKMEKGKRANIMLYGNDDKKIINTIITSFTSRYNAVRCVAEYGGNTDIRRGTQNNYIRSLKKNGKEQIPDAIDYYSVMSMLQVLLLGMLFGVYMASKELNSDIHIRIHSLPVSRSTLLFGKILGSTTYLFMASLFTVAFSKYVYGANWNGNIIIILVTLCVFSLMITGMGILVGLKVDSTVSAIGIAIVLMVIFSVLAGSISPDSANAYVGIISPNYYAKLIIFGTIYGFSKSIMIKGFLGLVIYTVLIYAAICFVFRRVRYDNI